MNDTKPKELTVGSLFSGIGGLDLGLERAGMRVVWQCEIDPYCRAVLKHHWDVPVYEDIRDIDGSAERVDLICGGFPCQPVSLAGKGLAQEDPRWLWPEFARVIRLLRPQYVLVENVPGLAKRGLLDVLTNFAQMGFDAEWEVVSAAACGAPHLRERLFVIATNADYEGQHGLSFDAEVEGSSQPLPDSECEQLRVESRWRSRPSGACASQLEFNGEARSLADANDGRWRGWPRYFTEENWRRQSPHGGGENGDWWAIEPPVGRVAHGVPNRLAQLRALGNAVVPQVAEAVGRMILAAA